VSVNITEDLNIQYIHRCRIHTLRFLLDLWIPRQFRLIVLYINWSFFARRISDMVVRGTPLFYIRVSEFQLCRYFLLHFFRLVRGFFLLNTSMWTANFIFSCATEWFRNMPVQDSAVHTQSFACSFYINQILVERVDWIATVALRLRGLGYFIQRNCISRHFIFS